MTNSFPLFFHWLLHNTQCYCFHLFPFPSHKLNKGSIYTHHLQLWPIWAFWTLCFNFCHSPVLQIHLSRSYPFRCLPDRRFIHLYFAEKFQFSTRLPIMHLSRQPYHLFFHTR